MKVQHLNETRALYVLYCYTKGEKSDYNLKHFIQYGGYNDDPTVQYYFIINGYEVGDVQIPDALNVHTLKRNNVGMDFGAWSDCLAHFQIKLNQEDRIIFINDTVSGPHYPWFYTPEIKWYNVFSSMITNDVKLAGLTINFHLPPANWTVYDSLREKFQTLSFPHVQSMFLVTDAVGLTIAQKYGIFTSSGDKICNHQEKVVLVINNEIALSCAILKDGFNLNAIAKGYHNLDYRTIKECNSHNGKCGDPWYPGAYFGGDLHPYETIFFKNNRGLIKGPF